MGFSRHNAVAAELGEWWEGVPDGGVGSRVVRVQAPEVGCHSGFRYNQREESRDEPVS
jgi:hypothetical protein